MVVVLFGESEAYKNAAEKSRSVGPLGLTADDHIAIGSTPSAELTENPGKTRSDLMDNEDILSWLREQMARIEELSADEYRENNAAQSLLSMSKQDLRSTLKYLEGLDRLPKEFREFEAPE